MRERLTPGGLRGRLLVAFVVTSMITLAVVAAIVLGPLQTQLRDQSVETLNDALVASVPEFQTALREPLNDPLGSRLQSVSRASFDLRQRVDTRLLFDADDDEATLPAFFYDSDFTPSTTENAAIAALTAIREDRSVTTVEGDEVTIALRLRNQSPDPDGVLVAQRRLTEVAAAADQVRNALLAGAGVGLLVAIALAVTLSGTLLRRLARLRAAALRITKEGPDAPAPRDTGRDEVGDLARALARMQEELRLQEAARRSFVSTASHELRTPLTMLQGTMELLAEDLRDGGVDIEDAQLQVTNARRELRRLSALAGELLDLSRLDAAVQLRSEPVELGELARAVAAEFELRAHERGVALELHPPAEGCWGRGDPDAVARVVRILIDNALRYGPPGEPILLTSSLHDGRAGVAVADRGPGIPPEEREHIFERFHRGRAAGAESGFGLGLAIGRELAERMGGSLRLADDEPPGARFELLLPTAEPDAPPRPARPELSRSS
ncbi:MAG TPA: HAMP domain-containing sensor histidine kinase [Solirubrobacteraceae bacterium]|jgi:signal transduction histidine kinase|nr:HAMP domain-containing sensor histidine kinase [Solirubrobacteraceae bacterium]